MRAQTQKALERATEILAANGFELTPAGFKYHSEKTWIGLTAENDVVRVDVTDEGPVVLANSATTQMLLTDEPAGEKKNDGKRGKKKKDGG